MTAPDLSAVPAAPSPVPPGDDWLATCVTNRGGFAYTPQADRLAEAEAIPATKKKTRADAIAREERDDGGRAVGGYISQLSVTPVDPADLTTLPASITSDIAEVMLTVLQDRLRGLYGAVPGILALAALLKGRAEEGAKAPDYFNASYVFDLDPAALDLFYRRNSGQR